MFRTLYIERELQDINKVKMLSFQISAFLWMFLECNRMPILFIVYSHFDMIDATIHAAFIVHCTVFL